MINFLSVCFVRSKNYRRLSVTLSIPKEKRIYSFFLNSWFHASWFNVNKKVQLDATIGRRLFTAQSLYIFRVSQHPSSGVLKTVSATSGIGHDTGTATSFQRGLIRPRWKVTLHVQLLPSSVSWSGHVGRSLYMYSYFLPTWPDQATLEGHSTCTATSFQRGLIRPHWKEVAVPVSWPIPEVADTVFSTPDDGCYDTRNM